MDLKQLREELTFNHEMVDLVDTLKNIAAAQFHQMLKEKVRFEQFMDSFSEFFRVVNLHGVSNPLIVPASDIKGVLIVTSDSGFMGGLNQLVARAAFEALGNHPESKTAFIVAGDKGKALLDNRGYEYKFFPGINQETIYEQAGEIKDYVVGEMLAGRMGSFMVAYPVALSFSSQTVETADVLPCAYLFKDNEEDKDDISVRTKGQKFLEEMRKVIVESSFSDIAEYLAGVWATSKLYEIFEDSKMAEFSARAMHLEGSLHKLEEREKKYKHMFFRASHEKIDKGMRDSFSATKTTKNKKLRKKKKDKDAADAAMAL
jgi:ATP synthase F1 gamma subunit